jgi:hypothetical protein
MWDLDGRELTGRYGRWNESTYELWGDHPRIATLVMSSEAAPGPTWKRRVPDVFYGEGSRWETHLPREEVTDVRYVFVKTEIEGVAFSVDAQRDDGHWAVSTVGDETALIRRLGLTATRGAWAGWVEPHEVGELSREECAGDRCPSSGQLT